MGSLYWQIDDCWPVASWSSIDYYGRWKALHYTAKHAYAPVLISPVVSDEEVRFYGISDVQQPLDGSLEISVMDFAGTKIFEQTYPVTLKSGTSRLLMSMSRITLMGDHDKSRLVILARIKNGTGLLAETIAYFTVPKELDLAPPEIVRTIHEAPSGYSVELTTNTLAKNVYLTCSDQEAGYTDNFFDLIPGYTKTIAISTTLARKDFERSLKIISLINSYQ
jgi:beta-mannosidase